MWIYSRKVTVQWRNVWFPGIRNNEFYLENSNNGEGGVISLLIALYQSHNTHESDYGYLARKGKWQFPNARDPGYVLWYRRERRRVWLCSGWPLSALAACAVVKHRRASALMVFDLGGRFSLRRGWYARMVVEVCGAPGGVRGRGSLCVCQ